MKNPLLLSECGTASGKRMLKADKERPVNDGSSSESITTIRETRIQNNVSLVGKGKGNDYVFLKLYPDMYFLRVFGKLHIYSASIS